MRLAITADIHDNLANLEKSLNWFKNNGVEKIICVGDVTNLETINFLAGNFTGEIFIIRGNADNYKDNDLKTLSNINYLEEVGLVNIAGLSIGLCHEPEKIKRLKDLNKTSPDFIFYGHTHKPWLEKDGQTIIANPGTLGGIFYPATFAILETRNKNLELKRLDDL